MKRCDIEYSLSVKKIIKRLGFMSIVFIILIAFLYAFSTCNLFIKLTMSERMFDFKKRFFLVLCMSLLILIIGFSQFVWAQIPICGILLFITVWQMNFSKADFWTMPFIISTTLLLISLVNYMEGLAVGYLAQFLQGNSYSFLWINTVFHLFNIVVIFSISPNIYRKFNKSINSHVFLKFSFFIIVVSLVFFIYYTGRRTRNVHQAGSAISPEELSLIVLFGLFIVFSLVRYGMQRQEKKMQKELMHNLNNYTAEIEDMYEELSMFRHDYLNILFSLRMAIEEKDINKVEEIFNDSILPTEKIVNDQGYEVARINQIRISEVKSLLHMKLSSARIEGLSVSVDIPDKIYSLYIDTVTYIRIISVLLDNAIENAVISEDKKMSIAIFEQEGIHTFIISNSTREQEVDVRKIFQKNYSTKEKNSKEHGWGLYYLKSIIMKSSSVVLETKSSDFILTQIIRIDRSNS